MALQYLHFWTLKTPASNLWHPTPGHSPPPKDPHSILSNLPAWLHRQDLEASVVDTAPFIAGVGALAHLRQANDFGLTASASIFRNARTLTALHRATLLLVPVVCACQAAGVEYRYAIPRWAHEREMRREEGEVRDHVRAGMLVGALCWGVRIVGLRVGRAYWAPVDVVLGGALADLMHREYVKAHGLSSVMV